MSEREVRRAAVLSRVAEGGWRLVEGAERMEVVTGRRSGSGSATKQRERRGWCIGARGGPRTGQSQRGCGGGRCG